MTKQSSDCQLYVISGHLRLKGLGQWEVWGIDALCT